MALQFKGGARVPGPLGGSPGGVAGRTPGPIGTPLWDQQTSKPAPSTLANVAKAIKKTVMPPPTHDDDNRDVHVVDWPLFSNEPAFTQVMQASGLANCPVASILAAMAFTSIGRNEIRGMLSEYWASAWDRFHLKTPLQYFYPHVNVVTDVSTAGTLINPPLSTTISSSRYFTVKVDKDWVDVSDVLYTDDADSGWSPF